MNLFKRKEMTVNRRFSDFLGLHDKLSEKYLQEREDDKFEHKKTTLTDLFMSNFLGIWIMEINFVKSREKTDNLDQFLAAPKLAPALKKGANEDLMPSLSLKMSSPRDFTLGWDLMQRDKYFMNWIVV
jgi:hypothetical protein